VVSRLIDLPFTRGLDESTDETAMALPAMTELVNYRLTRAGRLEHRLGVTEQTITSVAVDSFGSRPEFNKAQAIHQRFLAAGGHGYTCLASGAWACVGSLSRFVPIESYQGLQQSDVDFSAPSCASANGFLVVAGLQEGATTRNRVKVFDERTGALVYETTFGGTAGSGGEYLRLVATGNTVVAIRQNPATGDIVGCSMSMATLPIAGFAADVTIAAAAVAASGFDAAPFDGTTFLVSYANGANDVRISRVTTATLAIASTLSINDGAGSKFSTCMGTVGENYYLAWLNATSRNLRYAILDTSFVQVGATTTITGVAGTAFSTDNFRPVIGRASSSSIFVCWTDSYVTGVYETYRTTFAEVTNAASLTAVNGPMYGVFLASKPFQSAVAFTEGIRQPAIWLANHNPTVSALDRSCFLMLLGQFTSITNQAACSMELSAAPSAALPIANVLGTLRQVCDVVESTSTGPKVWQTLLPKAFRGLGTATPQRGLDVYRFGDASRSFRARTRAIVPCQGSFAVLGGAPRYHDTDRLVEIGFAHGPTVVNATPAATGSMTPTGVFRYVFVMEYFDGRGQRHLSYASDPVTVTLGAGDAQVNFELLVPSFWALQNITSGTERRNVVVRAYRTSNNGTVYRFAPATNGANGRSAGPLVARGRVTYQDTNSDADIAANEAVYVQVGNALSNYRAPPCRFGCEHEGRLVTAGGWNPSEYVTSKLFFAGEGIQFTESASFRDVCPEPITGCASLDGSLVLFAERGIYVVNGDGPTDDGVGSFSKPRKLPGRVGCVDWRSVVTTDAGAWFRSADGICLLPRGLASPQFVGAPIKGKLRSYPETLGSVTVTRAVAAGVADCDSEQVIAWLVGDAEEPTAVAVFMFSLATQTWSQVALPSDSTNLQTVIGNWTDYVNGTDVIAFAREELVSAEPGSLLVENPGTDYDQDVSGSYEPLLNGSWRTGKVFPFGFGGRGTIRALRLVGDCLSATTLTPTVYSDADEAGYASSALTFTAGRFAKEIPFRQKDIQWIQIGVADPTTGAGNRGAGLRFNGLALEVEMDPGLIRSPPANRSI
jgi:hypothetical protein